MNFAASRLLSIGVALAGCFAIDALAHSMGNDYLTRIFALLGLYATLAVSLNLINGITGQFSVGHAAFYQVGAYVAGSLSMHAYGLFGLKGVAWLLFSMVVSGLAAAVAGLIVGLPSLRLRGDYLAIVTLGFGEIIRIIVQNTEALGGSYGLNIQPKFQYVWLIWALAFLCVACCRNLLKTSRGLLFLAVREDEVASSAMGVKVTAIKVSAFVLGSMFAGAAGSLLAHYEGFITPATFAMDVSFIILTMVVLGGTGSITGSVVAALVLTYLPEYLRGLKNADGGTLTVSGASVIAALIVTAVSLGFVKKIIDAQRGTPLQRGLTYMGIGIAALIAKIPVQALISLNAKLAEPKIEAGQLRMVIFSMTLIALMLLRPQGIFGHHEFSWKWLRGLFQRRAVEA